MKSKYLLLLLSVSVIGSFLLGFLGGFHPYFIQFWPIEGTLMLIGFLIGLICLAIIIIQALRRKPILRYSLVWLFFVGINLIPGIYSTMTGSICALYLADSNQVLAEGRVLAQECQEQQSTYDCLQLANAYPSILRINPEFVWVDDGILVIEKMRIFGDSAGFLVYPENQEPSRRNGIIKIRDGLYWFDSHD